MAYTVECQYNKVPRDQENVFLITARGGEVLPMVIYTGRLRPKRGSYFALLVYERVGKFVVLAV